jgi:hypothetical protein
MVVNGRGGVSSESEEYERGRRLGVQVSVTGNKRGLWEGDGVNEGRGEEGGDGEGEDEGVCVKLSSVGLLRSRAMDGGLYNGGAVWQCIMKEDSGFFQ